MWPWAHAASGYLLFRLWIHRRGTAIGGMAVIVLAVGTILPDVIDKPLAWTFHILTSGRSLGHSLLVVGVVFGVSWSVLAERRQRSLLAIGTAGVLVHILGDAAPLLLDGEWHALGFLLWPIIQVEPDAMPSFLEHLLAIGPTPFFIGQTMLTLGAFLLWYRDGHPGLRVLLSRLR